MKSKHIKNMSISPQSLARTRDKRSLRVPARFDDFSEIPPEFVYRNVAEALRMKAKSYKKSHSLGSSDLESQPKIRPTKESSSSSKKASHSSESSSKKATSKQKERVTTPTAANESSSSVSTICSTGSSQKESKGSKESTPKIATPENIELECDETTPNEVDFKSIDELAPTTSESNIKVISTQDDQKEQQKQSSDDCKITPNIGTEGLKRIQEVLLGDRDSSVVKISRSSEKRDNDDGNSEKDEVIKIWKGTFHPSITIRKQNVKFSESTTKPLVEQRPNSAATPTQPSSMSPSKVSASRKKSKGFSLMVKPNNGTAQNNNTTHRQQAQPPTKYFNNLTPNMQYGTRLMLNEPVYLPRSVNTIAPITATLQQIVNQARKPPFISKKTQAYIAYQEERKLNYIAATHSALTRITKYLGVKDRINLRCVNRTWKSIVDCNSVWKKVLVTGQDKDVDLVMLSGFLNRFHTTDFIFEEYVPEQTNDVINGDYFVRQFPHLERVWIKSMNPEQNSFAFSLLESFGHISNHPKDRSIQLRWRVKVGVDDFGVASVDMVDSTGNSDSAATILTSELYDLEMKLDKLFKSQEESFQRYDAARLYIKLDVKPI